MIEFHLVTPENYIFIPLYESMKRDLRPDQKIIWDRGCPMVIQRSPVSLYCEKAVKEVLRVLFGVREHVRGYKRRVK